MKCRISQAHVRVYRAVEGAVFNAAHGHPKWNLTETIARSIAKRATGTLTAGWPDVLAARSTPSEANDPCAGGSWPPLSRINRQRKGERHARPWRSPLSKLHSEIGNQVGEAKRAGDARKVEILIEVLRDIWRLALKEQRRGS